MTFLEYAEKNSETPLTYYQRQICKDYDEAMSRGIKTYVMSARNQGRTMILKLITEYEHRNLTTAEEIKSKAELMAKALEKDLHVELCKNKDGLRIITLDRKVVK